jgi:hypothetical protein
MSTTTARRGPSMLAAVVDVVPTAAVYSLAGVLIIAVCGRNAQRFRS